MIAPPRDPRAERPLLAGTVRRVVRLDTTWPDAMPGTPTARMLVRARGHDVVDDGSGEQTIAAATVTVLINPGALVSELTCDPPLEGSESLVGRRAASGWRQAARELTGGRGLISQLLDDLPVAILVAGYAGLRTGQLAAMTGGAKKQTASRMADVCAGWASDGVAFIALSGQRDSLVPDLAPAPQWRQPDGPDGRVATGDIRRERRIDVRVADSIVEVDATFRDTWGDRTLGEAILHEYVVDLTADAGGTIRSIAADPRVLPYPECPSAAESAARLVGTNLSELGLRVPEVLTGTSSCTHLNDLLRSLSATVELAAALQ